ncbi:4-hydroxyphenylpyruvate dioxygenase-like protein isoform X2 [Synchiropus splendidus]|uniref:4-hydroxyphenylpyruvate dioxygenase-like protein isoform X2 n=1 Tax=Synchiropus splendidus TaxID=270530 RepID=UPI00237DE6D7|nr:4-hydroxyphenylpyruvate dioxygenase-like protein isoform X2 [Synchiropus splendidus]
MAALLRQLHHITVHVSNVEKLKNDLISKFKFNFFASRVDDRCRQLAFKKGAAVFVVNERPCGLNEEVASAPGSQRMTARRSTQGNSLRCLYDVLPYYHVDTVCNVCFEVEDVERSFEALRNRGCSFLVPPTVVQDDDGHVTYSVLKSAVGNVCHTLIDKSKYNGRFLPGFTPEQCEQEEDNCPVTHFDHLTYCCPRNSSEEVMGWYQQMFGFQRFFLQSKEDVGEGLLIDQDGVGLRLKAMEYWKCSETGMALPSLSKTEPDCKFVIAESLPGQATRLTRFCSNMGPLVSSISHCTHQVSSLRLKPWSNLEWSSSLHPPPTMKRPVNDRRLLKQDTVLMSWHSMEFCWTQSWTRILQTVMRKRNTSSRCSQSPFLQRTLSSWS